MAGFRQRARQHDMAVQNRARRIGDRILLIVALGQHCVERRNRSTTRRSIAGALDQRRQLREYRGRIALGGRWLADGERDFALRHRIAGQRVHQEQHVLALIAEVLGERSGVRRGLHPQER